jgi:hypothetical protein
MLRTELRGEDVVARVGDREFAIALPDTDADQGEIVAGWIGAKLSGDDRADAGPTGPTNLTDINHVPGLVAVGGGAPGFSVGRVTFEPSGGPVATAALLAAARSSTSGPSHLAGELGAVASEAAGGRVDARGQGGATGRSTGRRHLRSLRARDL